MSDWSDTIDAIAADLQANVTGLGSSAATLHKYQPADPTELEADGARHLAIFPIGDAAETTDGTYMANAALEVQQSYAVVVWESSGTDATRLTSDATAWATFLQLHNDTRARFLLMAQDFGPGYLSKYAGTAMPTGINPNRWFRIHILVREPLALT